MSECVESPGKSQEPLERLDLTVGLGMSGYAWGGVGGGGKEIWGDLLSK